MIGTKRNVLIIYILIASIALASSWLHIVNSANTATMLISQTSSFLTLLLAMALILKNIFANDIVTIDTIAESLCVYLLLGFAFAYIYTLIDIVYPNSFVSSLTNDFVVFSESKSGLEKIYFSFITLLTVGYGDVVPASHPAKLTTIIEGFFGQIYLVVMIARLVGMHVSQRSNNH